MKTLSRIGLAALMLVGALSPSANEADHHDHAEMHEHNHQTQQSALGSSAKAQQDKKYDRFVDGLRGAQVAIISVEGMVCDFCARGIEKTFKKAQGVLRVDVDLALGRVLVAYSADQMVEFEDIKTKITSNGQTAVALDIVPV